MTLVGAGPGALIGDVSSREFVDVSVIIPTYNRCRSLERTLACLTAQRPAPREIIIVDQSDCSDAAATRRVGALAAAGTIRLLRQPVPNAQRARNRAIREARGAVLLFLDDDVVMGPELVAAHWANYDDPAVDLVAGFYLEPGESPTDTLPAECAHPRTGWLHVPHGYTHRVDSHQFASCNGSVRRDMAIRAGGFDENFHWTLLDDTDFACRLRRLGARGVHDPAAALTHLKESSGGRRPQRAATYVIADHRLWYTWVYFYLMNFGIWGVGPLARRFRTCVLRRPNLLRPWYAVAALAHCTAGAVHAGGAMARGRRLGAQVRGEGAGRSTTRPARMPAS